ncbi:low-specificity L-threonine aldolase [Idiomarina tyrosinivorans]|uniref:Low-specificity L-threonine aldolase n=1 Tax=Idiomarina tyrosinivorans TaxID=1445662 RepID=A0A432ZTA7_9GAMM|nr:low-specificity L-threonine aldolase [Idiomarina tyrosinivorans]RUO81113.1 low-specificity L-threonine aldolase [Idiomarina tyrosinivorans]
MLDLRSDTVTKPTAAMREAMAKAEVGDDVYGEDPSINALEQKVAALLGKPAAILCSSGTQSNLLGLLSHCRNGEEYLVGQEYHTYRYEAGGAAVLGGIVPQPFEVNNDGTLDLALVEKRIKPNDPHFPISRLLALENTHTGKVMPNHFIQQARVLADRRGLSLHLDGARLANAAVASDRTMAELAAPFDSVSLCCSKGLGAPVGSLLAGSEALIGRARRWRKMVGGGMRQAGIIAAGINYALDNHFQRLAEDHDNARWLADALQHACSDNADIRVDAAQTNMVYVHFSHAEHAANVSQQLAQQGIKVPASATMRLVFHLDIPASELERLRDAFVAAVKG